jgi:DNA-binding NtrC family response regulator
MQSEKPRVLLVDDEEALQGLGQAMLTRLGYDVVVCSTSPDALATLAAAPERFALVVTDYTMPALTGTQLAVACWHLRPDLPVLLYTGWLEVPEAGHDLAPGRMTVLHKPFSLHELARTVQALVGPRPPEEDPVRTDGAGVAAHSSAPAGDRGPGTRRRAAPVAEGR